MIQTVAFDKHQHVAYNDLSTLFWGEFAYRVSVEMNPIRFRRCSDKHRAVLVERLLGELDYGDEEVVYRTTTFGHNFFFEDGDAASRFIDRNAAKVTSVIRPRHENEIELLRDSKNVFRDALFFNRYLWKIEMVNRDDNQIADFVQEMFVEMDEVDTRKALHDRFSFRSNGGKHTLYLRDESDVVLVKLAIESRHIANMQKALVRDAA